VPLDIRPIADDELQTLVETSGAGFLERRDAAAVTAELRPLWDLRRTWAAFDDGRMCGTFRSWATDITVPGGGQLPATAIAGVSVLPTHRRRGILRGMVAAEHAAARERGEALSLLWAAEYPIYGRFGYGPACHDASWALTTRATGFHDPAVADAGSVALVEPSEEAVDTIRGIFEAWRPRQPGEIRRRDYRWGFDLGVRPSAWGDAWKGFLAIHRDAAGTADGFARYHATEHWDKGQPSYTLNLDELHALTDEAYASLWQFLAGYDWVATIKADRRSPSERLPWLLTNARAASVEVGDGLWVRLLDIARSLEGRRYERTGTLVLEIADPESTGGRVRLELDAGADGASARPTTRSADLTLDVAALGAAYLGARGLGYAVLATGADEHRSGALAEADALFRTLDEPWCSTFF
jgi:predicted acetyltransferase